MESPPSRTLGEFCEPLRNFLHDEHIAPDSKIETSISGGLGKQLKEIDDDQIMCRYKPSDPKALGATSILSPVEGDFDLDATNKFLTTPPHGYRFLDGHSAPVWFQDHRRIDEMFQKSATAELTTTVGKWEGYIVIDDRSPLPISDEQISRLAEVLIEATRKMNEPPDGQE
ncbi:hypothetical protein ACFYT3_22310 [Nocardia amikacinitolerans]|uniref:hypothetical protein n=1 Tax=Nocardia amikacinitolerans TaxID=756689 RepID=UPI0036C93E76